jgi:hypothetical protein
MTTTKASKVAKPVSDRARPPKKRKRFSFYRVLAEEMARLTDQVWDPAYLNNLVSGSRLNKKLEREGTLRLALANLAARGITQTGRG